MAITRQEPTLLRHIRRLASAQKLTHLSDRELLHRFAGERDEAAFAALVRRHGAMVLHVGQRVLHNGHDAEDVFQATFLVLTRKAGSIRWHESVGNWLYQAAYRIALKAKTAAARRGVKEAKAAEQAPADSQDDLSWREVEALLDEELHRLPVKYRAPLVFCYLEGSTRDEAAQQLGWSLSTLKRRLERGRELLRLRLIRRGLTFSAALFTPMLTQTTAKAALAPGLVQATVRSALQLAAGEPMAGLVSAPVAELVKGGLKTMLATKLKVVTAVLLAVSVVTGAGALSRQALTGKVTAPQPAGQKSPTTTPEKALAKDAVAEKNAESDKFQDSGKPTPGASPTKILKVPGVTASLSWSPDGTMLAIADRSSGITLWDVRARQPSQRIVQVGQPLPQDGGCLSTAAAFSPDGKTLACVVIHVDQKKHHASSEVQLWDVATRKRIGVLAGAPTEGTEDLGVEFQSDLLSMAYSPDGRWIAACGKLVRTELIMGEHIGGEVCVWDARTGKLKWHNRTTHSNIVYAVAFSPDGRTLASGGLDPLVRLWDPESGNLKKTLFGAGWDGIVSLAFSPDGATLAGGGNGRETADRVHLWDLSTGRFSSTGGTIRLKGTYLTFSPDGKLWALGRANDSRPKWGIRSWDVKKGETKDVLAEGPLFFAYVICVSPDGKTLAVATGPEDSKAADSHQVKLYDLAR